MPLPCPEKDLRLPNNEGRPGFPDVKHRERKIPAVTNGCDFPLIMRLRFDRVPVCKEGFMGSS